MVPCVCDPYGHTLAIGDEFHDAFFVESWSGISVWPRAIAGERTDSTVESYMYGRIRIDCLPVTYHDVPATQIRSLHVEVKPLHQHSCKTTA